MQAFDLQGLNAVLGNAGLTGLSGAATTYSTSAVTTSVRGKASTRGAVSGGASPTTDGNSGLPMTLTANKGCVFVWTTDAGASGAIRVYQSRVLDLDSAGNFLSGQAPEFPNIPDTTVAFAYVVARAGSTLSGTWTHGSSNWNATGLTLAVQNVTVLPDRLQVS